MSSDHYIKLHGKDSPFLGAPNAKKGKLNSCVCCASVSVCQIVLALVVVIGTAVGLLVADFSGSDETIYSVPGWVPELDSDANVEQIALYDSVRPYLPTLNYDQYPNGTVRVYIFGSPGDRTSCTDNITPLHWVWYSTEHLVPILTGFTSNGCGLTDTCPNNERYGGSFYTCGISGVTHASYTYSGFDRGHMVNSQALARIWGASCQTFNMCNIAPQSPQMNQRDWLGVENLVQGYAEKSVSVVMQGSLISTDTEPQCVCGSMDNGTIPCSLVTEQGDCNDGNWKIRVPYGFFKTVIDVNTEESWTWLYTKAQSEVGPQPTCSPTCETTEDAFLSGSWGVRDLESAAHFTWPLLRTTARYTCEWCAEAAEALEMSFEELQPDEAALRVL